MSRLTDHGENKLADLIRGQAWSTLSSSLYVGLASAASDSSITELTGTGYARQTVNRSLAAWAGTQGAGTTLASSGSSHLTSNNGAINFGTAGSAWGTSNYFVLYDAVSGGNAIAYTPTDPISIGNGDPVSILSGQIVFTLGLVNGATDYLANKLIDLIFRGQAFSFPANMYVSLFTTAPTNAGGGAEVNTGSYARVALACSLTALSGTQSSGSTSASSGTGGRISNNALLSFPTPTANWNTVEAEGLYDASTAGNLLFWRAITPRTIDLGVSAPSHQVNTLAIVVA